MTSIAPANSGNPQPRKLLSRIAIGLGVGLAVLAVVFFAGPRNSFGPDQPTSRPLPADSLAALDAWVKNSEAAYTDIKPGTGKEIVWNTPEKTRTPWAVVYLHGFSASRLETAPVTDKVAKALGANAFHTRLSGHGRTGAAMAEANVQDWMADAIEAVRIGQTLGERVLMISCSTGATLATWLATSPEGAKVAAHVFLSPNFGPKDKRADLVNGPWGQQLTQAILGDTRGWTPTDDAEANAWTTSYPTRAVYPMMAMVKHVRESDLSGFQKPLLVMYSPNDQVVDPVETEKAFTRVGSPLKTLEAVTYSTDKNQHVLAGQLKAPESVETVVASIVKWTQALPKATP